MDRKQQDFSEDSATERSPDGGVSATNKQVDECLADMRDQGLI